MGPAQWNSKKYCMVKNGWDVEWVVEQRICKTGSQVLYRILVQFIRKSRFRRIHNGFLIRTRTHTHDVRHWTTGYMRLTVKCALFSHTCELACSCVRIHVHVWPMFILATSRHTRARHICVRWNCCCCFFFCSLSFAVFIPNSMTVSWIRQRVDSAIIILQKIKKQKNYLPYLPNTILLLIVIAALNWFRADCWFLWIVSHFLNFSSSVLNWTSRRLWRPITQIEQKQYKNASWKCLCCSQWIMSMWTTSTTGLETALAAAIGSTLQQHTITNNLKGQAHILHIGNGTIGGAGAHHHHNNNNNNNNNHSSSHHHSSHPQSHHNSHSNIQQAVWNRNTICSNHQKVRIELNLTLKYCLCFSRQWVQCDWRPMFQRPTMTAQSRDFHFFFIYFFWLCAMSSTRPKLKMFRRHSFNAAAKPIIEWMLVALWMSGSLALALCVVAHVYTERTPDATDSFSK